VAATGTARNAPVMPNIVPPAATDRSTTAACRLRFRPCRYGERTLPSSCWTATTTPRAMSASVPPFVTSVTSTASAPLMKAPMIGM
jgi:hypothetical protein